MSATADIDSLRGMVGSQSTKDDGLLAMCLESAGGWIYDRVEAAFIRKPEVQQAILLLAARLYKRRNSPEGVAGWEDLGAVRIIARDPDIERLIEQYVCAYKVFGIS
jgi:hypothetical protein